jgi:hypothetical protein
MDTATYDPAAISQQVVGTTAAQTLTNKTLTGASNNITARSLRSATTTIDVSAAAAPSSGQVLTATGGTAATWQTVSGGDPAGFITLDTADQATAGAAINNAFAALPLRGGTVFVPSGDWTLDVPVLWNKHGLILQGASDLTTRLAYAPGTVTTAIKMADTVQRSGSIRDIHIDATGANGGTAIDASYFVSSTFERLRIGEGTTRPQRGIVFGTTETGSHYNSVRDCSITVGGTGSYGLLYDNEANSNYVYNVTIRGDANTVGLRTIDAHSMTLIHLDVEGTAAIGAQIRGNGTRLIGCYFESITLGLQLEAGTESFAMIGGYLECQSNLVDNGAIDPMFINVWRSFENYTNLKPTPRLKTASYTLAFFDADKSIEMNTAGASTITVPPDSSVKFPLGIKIEIVQVGAGQVTIAAGAGVTLRTARSLTTRVQWSVVFLQKRATDEWVVSGDLT